jgi:hypothetical protein
MWRRKGPAGPPGPPGTSGGGTNAASSFGPSGQEFVQAVAADPPGGWTVIGAFYFTGVFTSAVLEAIYLVSNPLLTARVRLFDMTAGIPVPGSTLAGTSSTIEVRQTSVNLIASMPQNRIYQFQAEAVGGSADTDFVEIREAKLIIS